MNKSNKRTCAKPSVQAYWEADISTAVDVAIRLSDNDNYDSHRFVREVIRRLKGWGAPPDPKKDE